MRPAIPLRPAPPGGLTYPTALQGPDQEPIRLIFGVVLAVSAFLVLVPLLAQAFIGLGWAVLGRGRPFAEYSAAASAYEIPEGVAATHLALSCLLLISMLVYAFLHRRDITWLVSVQPGWRLRYLVVCLVVAAVVLNAALWASFVLGAPDFGPPQAGWPWFVLAILITYIPFLPIPGAIIYAVLGAAGTSLRRFLTITVLGAFVSRVAFFALGYWIGEPAVAALEEFGKYMWYVSIALVIGVVVVSFRSARKQQLEQQQAAAATPTRPDIAGISDPDGPADERR